MAQISRSTKISGGTTLTSSTLARAVDVETDSLTLFNAHNNHDTGTSKWTVVSALGATSVPLVVDNSTGTQDIADLKANGVTKVAVDATGHIQAADGTQGLPEYSFASGNTNGLYMAGTNNPAISVSGTKRLDISTTAATLALPLAMGANKITGLANGTASTDAMAFGQCFGPFQAPVLVNDTTTLSSTSSTYTNTSLAATITPTSASHRIKITVSGEVSMVTAGISLITTVKRGSTDLSSGPGFALFRNGSGVQTNIPVGFVYIDSPATTSATTYTVAIKNNDNTTSIQWNRDNLQASIILEEIV